LVRRKIILTMTKNELIFTVFEKLKIQSDDTNLSEELVSSLLDTKRALLIKQQYSAKPWHMPREIKQELCMSLRLVDSVNGYSCAGKILQTNDVLPASIKVKGKDGPLLVRKEDNSVIAINIVPTERIPFLFANKFTAMLTYASVDYDGKLVLISADNKHRFLQQVKVTDVFEAPELAMDYECKQTNPNADVWDLEYPIEVAMTDTIINMVVQDLSRTLQIPTDQENNAADDRERQAAPARRR